MARFFYGVREGGWWKGGGASEGEGQGAGEGERDDVLQAKVVNDEQLGLFALCLGC